jgi:hypothetical protein
VADREDREEGDAVPQEEPAGPPLEDEPASPPLDEDAVWAALIAGFHTKPEPGTKPSWPEAENVTEAPPAAPAKGSPNGAGAEDPESPDQPELPESPAKDGPTVVNTVLPPPDRSIVIHPVIKGPRDFELIEDDEDAHFVPPEPPPLPEADVTTKFAWIAVLGGPLLLLAFVLFQLELTWWSILVGVGGFLGGFATLVARMGTGEDDDDLPGGGAVV